MMGQKRATCRWAALSLSSIASVFLPDLQLPQQQSEIINHEVVAISTTGSKERATTWITDHNIINAESIEIYYDWQEMLEKGDFDIVYISTPHSLHYQHVKKALEMKRNVLVEKPATMNAAQYKALADLARKQGVVLMEAMWTRYLPATKYLQNELLPRIGEVKRVYADFSFPIVSDDLPLTSRFLDKGTGAGSLLDQGVYALTWADIGLHAGSNLNSATKVVHASTMSVPNISDDVDDIDTVILSKQCDRCASKQEAVAIVTTGMTLPGSNKPAFYKRLQANKSGPSVRIEAVKASIAIPFPPIRPQRLHVQWYDEDHLDDEGMEMEEVIEKPVVRGWGMRYQADVIAERVLFRKAGAEGEVIGGDETLRVLTWTDEARKLAGIYYDSTLDEL